LGKLGHFITHGEKVYSYEIVWLMKMCVCVHSKEAIMILARIDFLGKLGHFIAHEVIVNIFEMVWLIRMCAYIPSRFL
jgi:hypothetical protein